MLEPFVGEIALLAFAFPPKGWALCNGQLLPINQNQALFSLLGTTYGGNGQTTFALPNLQGRAPMHVGGSHLLGETGGAESVTVVTSEMPAHPHTIDVSAMSLAARARNLAATQRTPVAGVPAIAGNPDFVYIAADANANMASGAITIGGSVTAANAGGSQPHENRQPYLCISYCIALVGVFPSQNP